MGRMTDYFLTTTPGGRQGLALLETRGSKMTVNLTKERARILREDYGLSIFDISELVHANPLQVKAWLDA